MTELTASGSTYMAMVINKLMTTVGINIPNFTDVFFMITFPILLQYSETACPFPGRLKPDHVLVMIALSMMVFIIASF